MPVPKFLKVSSGSYGTILGLPIIEEAVNVSAGAGSVDKIPCLDETGKLDPSMLPTSGASSGQVAFNFSAAPDTITANSICVALIPITGNIVSATLHGQGASGSATVEIYVASTPANIPTPTLISAANPLILTLAYGMTTTTFTGWTVALTAGQFLIAKVTSTNLTQLNVSLKVE